MENEIRQSSPQVETPAPNTIPARSKKKVILLVLLILITAGLAFSAAYFWQQSKNDNLSAQLSIANAKVADLEKQTTQEQAAATVTETNKTADWLTYTASGYTIKLADGWIVMKKQGDSNSLIGSNSNLKYIPGTKAIVKDYATTGSGESKYGLSVDYAAGGEKCNDTSVYTGYKLAFKTNSGSDVYSFTQTGNGSGAYNLKQGDKEYDYCVQLSDNTKLVISYRVASGTPTTTRL